MIHLSEYTTCAFVGDFFAIRDEEGTQIVLDADEVAKLREVLNAQATDAQD